MCFQCSLAQLALSWACRSPNTLSCGQLPFSLFIQFSKQLFCLRLLDTLFPLFGVFPPTPTQDSSILLTLNHPLVKHYSLLFSGYIYKFEGEKRNEQVADKLQTQFSLIAQFLPIMTSCSSIPATSEVRKNGCCIWKLFIRVWWKATLLCDPPAISVLT